MMLASKTFKADGEFHIARSYNILNLKVGKLCVETEFLNNSSIFARGEFAVIFGLCASDDHLTRRKDESSGLRITDTHNDSRETLET